MSRPLQKKSLDAVSSATAGESYHSKAHNSIGVFVVARGFDGVNDTFTVRVETAIDDTGPWATIDTQQGGSDTTRLSIDEGDLEDIDGDGTHSGFKYAHGVPAPHLRANLTSINDAADGDLELDAYIVATNNANGNGHSFD